ncbi:MAG: ArsA-related P-loop ATPase [Acidimicrobiales bacterium]
MTPPRRAAAPEVTIEQLCAAKEIVISTGSGGVGKTTTAAALGAQAALTMGAKVLVLTVDPAKRLANAMGLQSFGNVETRVPTEAFVAAGAKPEGELWAAMLDTKQSWDDLIARHAPDRQTRDDILANPLYQNITGKFVQSHDYVAMERLYEIHTSGRYDLIVVDTPPTRNAVDFLDAPERMADFFSSRLLRWLIAPYRSKVVSFASKPFYSVADRILGTQFLQDIAEFFILFQSMYDGFVERADAVQRLLASPSATFIVVSTLEAAPAREAQFFLDLLNERELHVGALVLNKVLPDYLLSRPGAEAARKMAGDAATIAESLGSVWSKGGNGVRVLEEIGASFTNYQLVAQREAELRGELSSSASTVATVPYFSDDIADLAGLLALGERLWTS